MKIFLSLILAMVFSTLALPATADQSVPYASYTQMFAGADGFRGLYPGSPEYQWHHLDATHSDVVWGNANWPGPPTGTNSLEHFSVNNGWIELTGWDTTTDGVTGESPRYTEHVTLETSGNSVVDTSDGAEKYSYASLTPGESYSLQTTGIITQDNAPAVALPFRHTMTWSVSTDGLRLTQWENWEQGTPLTQAAGYPRSAVLTAGMGFTSLANSAGWSNTESAYETW